MDRLLKILFEDVVPNPGPYQEQMSELKVPHNLCAAFERQDLQEAAARRWSRFSQPPLIVSSEHLMYEREKECESL